MEYHDSPEADELAARAREFVDEVVIPTEREHLGGGRSEERRVGKECRL